MKLHPKDRVTVNVEAGWWSERTWDDLLRRQVSSRPDALAVVDPLNRLDVMDGAPQRWTWTELDRQVDALAMVLIEQGVGVDDVVAIQLPNCVELVQSYLALHRIGAVATPFPVAYREYELTQLGQMAKMKAVLTATRIGDRPAAEIFQVVSRDVGTLDTILAWGDNVPDGVVSLTSTVDADADRGRLEQRLQGLAVDANDCVTICWTSGTEAVPKGVPRASNDWIAIAEGSVDGAGLTAEDVLLNPFPMVNMAGIGGMLVPWLLTGATLVQHHPFDLPTFLKQIAVERPTYTVAPPALLNLLLSSEKLLAAADLSSLRVIGSGSAPLSPWMIQGWKDRHGIDVTNLFGSNEGTALIGEPSTIPDPGERAQYFPRFGVADFTWSNRVSRGMRTRLVDLENGTDIDEPATPGELRISGPTVFAGYLDASGGDAAHFDEQGFFRTGDIFELAPDERGELRYYRYVDRARDMIVRGGMNISPAEIESLLLGHPKVGDVAVVGCPDDILGERACALVVAAEGTQVTLEEIVAHLRDKQIASYKLPERLELLDALPRNPLGKVLKRDLRSLVAARV